MSKLKKHLLPDEYGYDRLSGIGLSRLSRLCDDRNHFTVVLFSRWQPLRPQAASHSRKDASPTMNEDSVPSTHKPIDYRVVQVWPAQTCHSCPRLTHVAIIDDAFIPDFTPVCPLHGYAQSSNVEDTPEQAEAKLASVCRFILWMHADMGTVPMVVPISDLTSIPGYEAEALAEVEELAWHARYAPPEGERIHAYAVWSVSDRQFSLYEQGQLIETRQREQVA